MRTVNMSQAKTQLLHLGSVSQPVTPANQET